MKQSKRFNPRSWISMLMAIAIVLGALAPLIPAKIAKAAVEWRQSANTF